MLTLWPGLSVKAFFIVTLPNTKQVYRYTHPPTHLLSMLIAVNEKLWHPCVVIKLQSTVWALTYSCRSKLPELTIYVSVKQGYRFVWSGYIVGVRYSEVACMLGCIVCASEKKTHSRSGVSWAAWGLARQARWRLNDSIHLYDIPVHTVLKYSIYWILLFHNHSIYRISYIGMLKV